MEANKVNIIEKKKMQFGSKLMDISSFQVYQKILEFLTNLCGECRQIIKKIVF